MNRIAWPSSFCGLVRASCPPALSVGMAYRVCNANGWEQPDLSRCVSKTNPAAIIGSVVDDPNFTATQLAKMQAEFLKPNNTIFGGDVASSIMMMDTLLKLQQAELEDLDDKQEIKEKAVQFTKNLGFAVSNLMDDQHTSAWEDIPKKEWASRATKAIELLEEAGFLLAQQALDAYVDNGQGQGIIEVHQSYPNTALQVAAILPAGADLPDEVMFPNQSIPVYGL